MSTVTPILSAALLLLLPACLKFGRSSATVRNRPGEITPLLDLFWWINLGYCKLVHKLVVFNQPRLPDVGPALLVSNHTSGIDHFILQAGCRRVLGFLIAKEFYDVPVGAWFCRRLGCIPVNRDGHDLAATRAALRALGEARVVPIFPEGRITHASGREFGEGKPGAAFLAIRSNVPVIPAYIRGTPIVSGVWTAWYTPSRVRLIFGEPVELSDLSSNAAQGHAEERAAIAEATDRIMSAIRTLRERSLAAEDLA